MWTSARAQCDATVPSFTVDLSSSPNAAYLSPNVQRLDHCCGVTDPDQCVEFIITLHPQAQGIVFNICSGAIPGGSMFYQLNCGPATAVGSPLCLNGTGPHIITFCKPGNNFNEYCITSIAAPTAGSDTTVNDGCSAQLLTTGFAPGTVTWTSISPGAPGAYDAYLSCTACENTVATGGLGYPSVVSYQVCGNALSPCNSVVYCDTVQVFFNPTLTATILPQQPTICYGAFSTSITAVGGGGTPPYSYLWNTGQTTATIPAGLGTYTVEISDATNCPPTITSVTVTEFVQPIQALAGPDITDCDGGSVQLNAVVTGASGGIWLTGGGQYLPSTTDLNATYTPSAAETAAGTAMLVLETTGNGTCPGDQDTLVITIPPPIPNFSLSVTDATCPGASTGTASVMPPMSSFSYLWNDAMAQTSSTATGLGAGPYSVTITDQAGCNVTLSTTVGEATAISVTNISVINESCAGMGDGSVSVTASGGTAPYSYTWSNGFTTPSITVGAGTYTVSVTDDNACTPATATATVIALAQPNVAIAGADQLVCMNDYPVALSGTVQNATGGTWSGGTGSFAGLGLNVSYTPSAAEIALGSVDLLLTTTGNSNCPAATDVLHLTLPNSFLNAALTHTNVLCAGGNSGTATFSPALPSLTYAWTPSGQNTPTAFGLAAGTHTVTVTDANGCDTTLSTVIAEPPPLQITGIQVLNPLCAASTDGSASIQVQGGTPGYSYQWSANAGGQTTQSVSGLGSGSYIVLVTDASGCTIQGTATVVAPAPVSLTVQVPDTVCVNAPVQLTAQASGGNGNITITWAGIGTGNSVLYSFPASQNVLVTATDGNGCTSPTLSPAVHVLDLTTATLSTYGDTTVCNGDPILVGAQVLNYAGQLNYNWVGIAASGPGPHQVVVTSSQVLQVTATNVCGQSLQGSIQVVMEVPPLIALPGLLGEGCAPLTVQFPDSLTTQPVTWLWNLGDGTTSTAEAPVHTYGAGQYTVSLTVTTPAGCSANAVNTGSVIVHPSPVAGFSASTYSTDMNAPTVVFTDASTGSINGYEWDFGDGGTSTTDDPLHTYTDVGTYTVQLIVTDVNGCSDEATALIEILPIYDIVIPNAFTPNQNGGGGGGYDLTDLSNDVFYPFVDYVKDYRMRIWNRWGELVFESTDLRQGWDGYYRGQLSPQDVYVYQCWVEFVDNHQVQRMGDVTLLR